jgi:steroid 5-alpha reductase family enzyme
MSEQDVYSSHLGISQEKVEAAKKAYDLRHSTGSEQERYASHFTWQRPDKSVDTKSGPESAYLIAPAIAAKEEQEPLHSRFSLPTRPVLDTSTVGILKSTLLPSLALQSGLSVIAYSGSRLTNRVDGKDWLWPAGQVINAWSSAIGMKLLCDNEDIWHALSELSYAHKLILSGVTLWGGRLFYRVVSRSIQRGHDEPRYEAAKSEPDFWNQSLFTIFFPEAVFQTLISLPFTLPFKETQRGYTPYPIPAVAELATGLGVFMFGAGFALEVLADAQLAAHYEKSKDLDTAGVWSIVRHPK